jgi:ubiquinone/menaquinone biosynthesis C-methylase UbiE
MSDTKNRWNEDTGHRWATHANSVDAQLCSLGEQLIEDALPLDGKRLLEVGCGAGALSLALASHVGGQGSVVALDVSTPLLDVAKERLLASDLSNVEFLRVDAQTVKLNPDQQFDRIVSRFGVMFFDDSLAAFKNLRCHLSPDGSMHFLCWGRLQQNDWVTVPRRILRRYREEERAEPDAPGPFRFQDDARLSALLREAGFSSVAVERLQGRFLLGGPGTVESAMVFCSSIGPAHQMHELPENDRARAFSELRGALEESRTDEGVESRYEVLLVRAKR